MDAILGNLNEIVVRTTFTNLPITSTTMAATVVNGKTGGSATTIVGVVVALVVVFALVGFLVWRHKVNQGGGAGIPHLGGGVRAAAPAPEDGGNDGNGGGNGEVPATYHNRMYNTDVTPSNNRSNTSEDFGSGNYAAGNFAGGGENARGRASTLYAIPMEADPDPGAGAGTSGDVLYATGIEPGTVMYVSALNQNDPEYATAVANDALYSVVNRVPNNGVTGKTAAVGGGAAVSGSQGGAENHYDMQAPGEKRRGQQQQQQHQQDGPVSLYDVAPHAGGSGTVSQSAEYSHLSPRGEKESNNMYDFGPQRHGGGGGGGGGGGVGGGAADATYEVLDSSV